ncbi:hypothetical protein [Aliikangiella coralliicola]|uniref:Uncharacterized protein n=1 Tax=Aliikangiella coralliicola TaxID=2592383 RepID=A0A545UGB8_9GAMM|nr:hypothetical protein [Aliikangiella coralliicola]TQV88524.1 hypothetical protein FLL46_08360 [Aliikangiella coralliicola]
MNQLANKSTETKHSKVTIRNGYWFYFMDGEHQIVFHGCGYSGKESVYFDNELVSETRNFRTRSEHSFEQLGQNYSLTFRVTSLIKGEVICELYKNGEFHSDQNKAYLEGMMKPTPTKIVLAFVFGLAMSSLGFWFGKNLALGTF